MKSLEALENEIVEIITKRVREKLLGRTDSLAKVRAGAQKALAKAKQVGKPKVAPPRKPRSPNLVVREETVEAVKAECHAPKGIIALRSSLSSIPQAELEKAVKALVGQGLLVKSGVKRNTVYALANGAE